MNTLAVERGGYDNWGGGWIFALVIIFFAVLMVAFRRREREHDGDDGWKSLIPAFALGAMDKKKEPSIVECLHDYKVSELAKDQAIDTGKIMQDAHVMHEKTSREICEAKHYQEKALYETVKEAKNDEIRKLTAELSESKMFGYMQKMKDELSSKLDSQYGHVQHHLDKVECEMLKRPPVWPEVYAPSARPC